MTHDRCFVTVGGEGLHGRQAAWLVRSLRRFHPDEPIYVGIPESEEQSVQITEATKLDIKIPYPEYPYSIKPEALRVVEEMGLHQRKIFLDSDTICTKPVSFPSEGDIIIKPENIDILWDEEVDKRWRAVYNRLDEEPPSHRVTTTVDKKTIWPYYQAGVFVTDGVDIADDLLDYISTLHGWIPHDYYAEQVALAVIANQHQTELITEKQNFPLDQRLIAPPKTEIIHYRLPKHLLRAFFHREIIRDIGVTEYLKNEYSYPAQVVLGSYDIVNNIKLHIERRAF